MNTTHLMPIAFRDDDTDGTPGYVALYLRKSWIMSQGDTVDEALANLELAYQDVLAIDGEIVPDPEPDDGWYEVGCDVFRAIRITTG